MSSPTQRSLDTLRKEGWTAQIVEKWNHFAKVRQDLFGIIDILAIKPGGILGVQATSGSNAAARITKSLAEPRLRTWLLAGGSFEVWSFSKKGPRGKRKLWTIRRQPIVLDRGEPVAFEMEGETEC